MYVVEWYGVTETDGASATVRTTREPARTNRAGMDAKAILESPGHFGFRKNLTFSPLRAAYFGAPIL
jgi:hypothetical protein